MKAETRLNRALARSVATMTDAVNTLYIEGTNYQSEPLDDRFKEGLRILRSGVRDGVRVMKSLLETGGRAA